MTPDLSKFLPKEWLAEPSGNDTSHLPTIREVKEKLWEYEQKFPVIREEMLHPAIQRMQGVDFMHPDSDVFIATKTEAAAVLKPNIANKHFLYRGQSEYHRICKPSIFRDKEPNHLAENVRRCEFEILLDSHPLYRLLSRKEGISLSDGFQIRIINPYGLAQHYGFKTALMDLTSDINVALFFATTNYDKVTDTYYPYPDSSGFGVLYVYHMKIPFSLLTHFDRLSTIGLQPFSRPGNQKGFLWMPNLLGECKDLHNSPFITRIFFRHNINVTNTIFANMDNGEKLFKDEELNRKARRILSAGTLSGAAFERNLNGNPNDIREVNLEKLKDAKIEVDFSMSPVTFTQAELESYYKWVEDRGWEDFCSQIVFPHDADGKLNAELRAIKDKPEYRQYFYR